MKNIYELIDLISERTAMYTGECKLSNIRSYLDGYYHAVGDVEFLDDFPGFHDWIAQKYGFNESTAGWQNMILAVELNLKPNNFSWVGFDDGASNSIHENSVSRFFCLVSEYRSRLTSGSF